MILLRSVRFVLVGVALVHCPLPVRGAESIEFNRDVRPILSENCFHCHGPDSAARQADLRLDLEDAAKASVIVAGHPDLSELLRRITSTDDLERMPPPDSERSLTPRQIALLRRWIAEGADYQPHWSFISPTKRDVPDVSGSRDANWCRNPIDNFVLSRLLAEGRVPSPEATRETLIRRATFDLTGLPPTLAEIDAFLADHSPQALERVVDRLLASQHFGERMTSDWLDVARYSDTYGYQVDRDRFVWPWRDWVVRAFNTNMPYDEFVTRQLAGDLLDGAGRQEILATTFNRLHPQKVEGGSVPEEFRVEYIADRTQTFATAMLGLTMECCRCHDHKFDPISQREYYQLSGFFDQIDEAGLYSYFTESIPTPTLLLPTAEQSGKIDALRAAVAAAEVDIAQLCEPRDTAFPEWLAGSARSLRARQNSDTHSSIRPVDAGPDSSTPDSSTPDRGGQSTCDPVHAGCVHYRDFEADVAPPNQQVDGKVGRAVKLTGDDPVNTDVGNFTRAQPFSVALWMQTPDVKPRAVIFHRSRAWTDAASRGYELLIKDGRLSWSLIHFWPGNAISIQTTDVIPTGEWLHVCVTYDGSSRANGLTIFINGEPAATRVVRDRLTKQITGGGGDNIAIGERFRDRGFTGGLVDEFRVYDRRLTPIEVRQLHDSNSLTAALETPADELTDRQREDLRTFYDATVDAEAAARRQSLRQVRTELNTAVDAVDEIMVMREIPRPRPTYLLERGAYDARGERVQPLTPSALPPFPADAPRNRLGLARWLTDPRHPLTSRVAVNRLWQLCFGRGLVMTPEDFGSQGRPPTHPLLLDWLAVDFVEHGWDVKRLLKQIVMSSTYRQSSAIEASTPAALSSGGASAGGVFVDPENRLLGRGSSYRLPAEMLRDNALAVSGLLVDRIGGPPVKPYEVEESFKPSPRDQGDGLYRRSLYTYWKRTGPAPVMMMLDASPRDVCRVNRERTASPLQSLVLLNGPQYTEASRVLAERLVRQHGNNLAPSLTDLFRLLTSRRPADAELDVLTTLFQQQLTKFHDDPDAAARFLSVGDAPRDDSLDPAHVAALATVAATLFNFDECVTKR